jgi:hypothetical protein
MPNLLIEKKKHFISLPVCCLHRKNVPITSAAAMFFRTLKR